MQPKRNFKPATLAVHAGARMDPSTRAAVTPVYRTAAFAFDTVGEMAEAFEGRKERYIYTRYGNPTMAEAEARLAALEGAEGAVTFASGMAALTALFLSVARSGDHILAQQDLYGGTTTLLRGALARAGVEVTFVPIAALASLRDHLRPGTRAVHVESPTNPTLRVVDIADVARQAREAGVALIVDNTFATPVNQKPLSLGADFSVHSATKFLSGHGDLVAGAVAAGGEALERVRKLRRETGAVLDAEAAWILARSLRTLPLRVEAHNRNALRIAGHLENRADVAVVHYPGLESHAGHEIAARQMGGFGGLLSFELVGGEAAARRFVEALEWIPLLPTLGCVETSVLVPAVSSHSMIPAEERRRAGVTDGLVRMSVGIEDAGDLIAEIDSALDRAAAA